MTSPSTPTLIDALMGLDTPTNAVHVASFKGDPHDKNDARWNGFRWSGGDLPDDHNNFICMGALDPNSKGRSLAHVTHHVAFWMDDVGTKVPLDRVQAFSQKPGLAPTAKIETSPGNFSWTWRLRVGVPELPDSFDAQVVAAVRYYLKRDGWGDPAAQDAARYMRIAGVNGKKAYTQPDGSPFKVRVHELSPSNDVDLADFAEAIIGADWQTVVKSGAWATSLALRTGAVTGSGSNERRATMDDPLVKLAAAVGLQPQPSTREGVIDCRCPNEGAHTGGDPTGYAIINDGMSYCNHASCQHLRSADFRDMMSDMYDAQVSAGLMFGTLVEDADGAVTEVATGEVVPRSGQAFLAVERFAAAPVEVDGLSVEQEADALAGRQMQQDEDRERALTALLADLVYVNEAEAFWHRTKKVLMQPTRLDREPDVLAIWPVGETGKNRAANRLLNLRRVQHVDTLVQKPGASDIVTMNGPGGAPVTAINTYVPGKIGRRKGTPTKFLAHVQNMFPGDKATADYLIEAFAWMLQNPTRKTSIILLLGGEPGVGKDFVLNNFFKLVGTHNVSQAPTKALASDFNDFLATQYVSLGEFTLAGREGALIYATLKDLSSTTSASLRRINPKYGKAYLTEIAPRFVATTNDDDALSNVASDDRRIFVAWSTAVRLHGAKGATVPMTDDYFDDLVQTYERQDELEVLHDYLLTLPVKVYHPDKAPPRSTARHNTLVSSLSATGRYVYDLVMDGDFSKRSVLSYDEIAARALASDNPAVRNSVRTAAIKQGLTLAGCKSLGQVRVNGKRASLWTGSCADGAGALTEAERKAIMELPSNDQSTRLTDEQNRTADLFAGVAAAA